MKRHQSRRNSGFSKGFDKFTSKIFIPSCVFNDKLTSFETIVKFLRENYGFSFSKIANLLSRKKSSVFAAYKSSQKKYKESLQVVNLYFLIPIDIFKDPSISVLESLVLFLKEFHQLSFWEIAALLMRQHSTIRTAYLRAKKKHEA